MRIIFGGSHGSHCHFLEFKKHNLTHNPKLSFALRDSHSEFIFSSNVRPLLNSKVIMFPINVVSSAYIIVCSRLPADRMVQCALMALLSDSVMYPTGSLFSDCQGVALPQLVAMAANRAMWRAKVASLS